MTYTSEDAMKSRAKIITEAEAREIAKEYVRQHADVIYGSVEQDCTYQAIATTLCILHREFGFGKNRLQKLKDEIESEYKLMMEGVLDREYSPRDCQQYLLRKFGIDLTLSRYKEE